MIAEPTIRIASHDFGVSDYVTVLAANMLKTYGEFAPDYAAVFALDMTSIGNDESAIVWSAVHDYLTLLLNPHSITVH